MSNLRSQPIIFFDGFCNLCTWSVVFVLKRDKNAHFKFASLQSEIAKTMLNKATLKQEEQTTIILKTENKTLTESTAILNIAKKLNGLWPLLYAFMIIPKPLRDFIYRFISKNRYKWFGKKTSCFIPDKDYSGRFLENS